MPEARRIYGERADLVLCDDAKVTLQGADCLAVVTEWQEFRSPDFDFMRSTLKQAVIFDGRNLYEPAMVARYGFKYFAIGRGDSVTSGKA
jgi:UDPglucose 6-dehydrogenase